MKERVQKNSLSGTLIYVSNILLVFSIALLLFGCAKVEIRKIPTPSQYTAWDDKRQEKADDIEGFRYYLPRPFIVVKQEFPVSSNSYLVNGQLTGDRVNIKSINVSDSDSSTIGLLQGNIPVSDLVTKDFSLGSQLQGDASSNSVSSKPEPTSSELKDAVISKNGPLTLQHGGSSLNLVLEVKKSTLESPDAQAKHVRNLFLVPRKSSGGAPESLDPSKWLALPWVLYEGGTDTGTLTIKGHFEGLKKDTYILGIEYFHLEPDGRFERKFAYTPASQTVLTVINDPISDKNPDPGTTLSTDLEPRAALSGLELTVNNLRSKSDRFSLTSKIKKVDLSIVTGTKFWANADAAKGKHLTAVGVAPSKGDSVELSKEARIPFDLVNETDTEINVSANTILDGLSPNNYRLVFHITTGNDDVKKTQIVFSKKEFPVGEEVIKRPEEPKSKVGKDPDSTSPAQSPDQGDRNRSTNEQSTTTPSQPGGVPAAGKPVSGGAGSLNLVISKNAATSPTFAASDFFNVLYLPDFEEQYAINPKPRFSLAKVAMNLENGWMLEGVNMEIDNSNIADFIFSQIASVTSLATEYFKLRKGLILPPQPEEPSLEGAVEDEDRSILLRIHVTKFAVPGVYPVLKPREIIEWTNGSFGRTAGALPGTGYSSLLTAIPPQTVVAFNVRNEIMVELVSTGSGTRGGNQPPPGQGPAITLKDKVQKILDTLGKPGLKAIHAQEAATSDKLLIEVRENDDVVPVPELRDVCAKVNSGQRVFTKKTETSVRSGDNNVDCERP